MNDFVVNTGTLTRLNKIAIPVQAVGYLKKNKPSLIVKSHHTINFGFILSAPFKEAKCLMEGTLYKAQLPAFTVIKPSTKYQQLDSDYCEKLYLSYDIAFEKHFSYFFDNSRFTLRSIKLTKEIKEIISNIFYLSDIINNYGSIDRLDYLCQNLLSEVIIEDNRGVESSGSEDRLIFKIASYFDLHFRENLNIEDIITQYGMCQRTFNRHWNKNFKVSPQTYIQNMRINESCRLLLYTDMKIYEIANKVGFYDPYYFSRVFKKTTHLSPKSYRSSH